MRIFGQNELVNNGISFRWLQEASGVVDIKSWPVTLDTDDMPKKKLSSLYRAPTAEMLAYLDFRLVFLFEENYISVGYE